MHPDSTTAAFVKSMSDFIVIASKNVSPAGSSSCAVARAVLRSLKLDVQCCDVIDGWSDNVDMVVVFKWLSRGLSSGGNRKLSS